MTPFVKFECSGPPYEMGRGQGEAQRDQIQSLAGTFFESDEVRAGAGRYLDARKMLTMAGSVMSAAVRASSSEAVHQWKSRVEGIADGAGIDRAFVLGAQAVETLLSNPLGMSHCTSVGVMGERTAGLGPLLLKNYDIGEILRPGTCLRTSRPAGKLMSFEMVINAMAGSHVAMNEAGLCLSYNYGMVRSFPRPGLLPTYLVQYALENFKDTGQAVRWLSDVTVTNGCVVTVLDRHSTLCVVEKVGSHTTVRFPVEGATVATNHFLTRELSGCNYDLGTRYGRLSPESIRGMSVQESNGRRLERARALLEDRFRRGPVGPHDLMDIARDHEGRERGDENTICRHHPGMATLASVILVPKESRALVCRGYPCSGTFEEVDPW